ncbi:PREDICTED: uncharacterized protein LOC105570784 [Vollenhovia emeryi]|uniref:uncharacterized protein LOC105570784 n=1 Tax=Vollenhovia emeryi TaxID=411798 RepID=UPI0005F586D6|nr:PREDICTED: uncharacterized protein LOC105570784 [Vollenhovia emeryi]
MTQQPRDSAAQQRPDKRGALDGDKSRHPPLAPRTLTHAAKLRTSGTAPDTTPTIRTSPGDRPRTHDHARAPRARRGRPQPPAHSLSPGTRPPAAPRHESDAPPPTLAAAQGDPADRRHQCPGSSTPRGTPPCTRGPPEGHALPAEDAERGGDPTRHGANDNMVTLLPRPTAAFTSPREKPPLKRRYVTHKDAQNCRADGHERPAATAPRGQHDTANHHGFEESAGSPVTRAKDATLRSPSRRRARARRTGPRHTVHDDHQPPDRGTHNDVKASLKQAQKGTATV